MTMDHPLYKSYVSLISTFKTKGFIRTKRIPGTHLAEYEVNEACLPKNVTNIHIIPQLDLPVQKIPLVQPSKEPSVDNSSSTPSAAATQAFLEAELRSIKIQNCKLGQGRDCGPLTNTHASIELEDVTLWDVYKIGLSLQVSLGTDWRRVYQEEEQEEEKENESEKTEADKGDASVVVDSPILLPMPKIPTPGDNCYYPQD